MAKPTPRKKGETGSASAPYLLDHERFVREGPQRRFIEPRLLYLIKRGPSYGYQLTEDIGTLPFPGPAPDSAAVYRTLRELERSGLVVSRWEHGEAGPSRRIYSITSMGEERLKAWVEAFRERAKLLEAFVAMCERVGKSGG
ncbi:MAG: PadR family transcriptional regulator [Actinobacteria bacterium]|nr:PadR family transcriptional regulator [Actinomycetota bacterium]